MTRTSPRVVVYGVVGMLAVAVAVARGEPEMAALGGPLLVLAVAGLVLHPAPPPAAMVTLQPSRLVEGDRLTLRVAVPASAAGRVEVGVALAGAALDGTPVDALGVPSVAWAVGPGDHERVDELATTAWGLVLAGPLVVRTYGPLALNHRTDSLPGRETSRVLPSAERLRTLLAPPPRAFAGTHRSNAGGGGFEFADIREHRDGDRLADVNWRASARSAGRELRVNDRHAERSGDLVLLIDSFADDPSGGVLALPDLARAAWAVTQAHLRSHDRVGVVAFGGYPWWLGPGGGVRARYALLDRLLSLQASWTDAPRRTSALPAAALPPSARVVALTALHDARAVDGLLDLRHRGRAVSALVLDTTAMLPPATSHPAEQARDLWRMVRDSRTAALRAAAVPVATWDGRADLGPVVALLARSRPPTSVLAR